MVGQHVFTKFVLQALMLYSVVNGWECKMNRNVKCQNVHKSINLSYSVENEF